MSKTRYGTYIEAYGDNPEATRISGVNVVLVISTAYMICNSFACVAGYVEAGYATTVDPAAMGLTKEMDAIAATRGRRNVHQRRKAQGVGNRLRRLGSAIDHHHGQYEQCSRAVRAHHQGGDHHRSHLCAAPEQQEKRIGGTTMKEQGFLKKARRFLGGNGCFFGLIFMIVVATLINTSFLTPTNISNVLRQMSTNSIIALGMAVVIISGSIDLSVGSLYCLSAFISIYFSQYNAVLAVVITLAASTFIGLINGLLVTKLDIHPGSRRFR